MWQLPPKIEDGCGDDDDGDYDGGGGGGGGYDVRSQEDPRQQIRQRGEQLMMKAVEI